LVRNGEIDAVEILSVASFPSLGAAIEAYLAKVEEGGVERPTRGALAVAGPVTGDWLSFTNHPWSFSVTGLTRELGLERLDFVNDFVAVALAMPHLGPFDRRQIGPGTPVAGMPIGIIGPGTGLGVSSLVPIDDNGVLRWLPLPGEGGHATLPAVEPREAAVIDWLHRTGQEHVSAERLISGQGITILYSALSALDGVVAPDLQPAEISARARAAQDPVAVETIRTFCAMLGTVAGNLALTVGARGGVYIAGGIVGQLSELFDGSAFRSRFVSKGRMQSYLDPIPTFVITHKLPAFVGLAHLAERD
jgi:glucokinase